MLLMAICISLATECMLDSKLSWKILHNCEAESCFLWRNDHSFMLCNFGYALADVFCLSKCQTDFKRMNWFKHFRVTFFAFHTHRDKHGGSSLWRMIDKHLKGILEHYWESCQSFDMDASSIAKHVISMIRQGVPAWSQEPLQSNH